MKALFHGSGNSFFRRRRRAAFVAALLFLLAAGCLPKKGETPLPQRLGAVNDFTGSLSPTALSALSASLESYERETCHQIVVVVIPSLEAESISAFSERVMKGWEIGHPHLENGLLITLALEEGTGRIDAGTGLEGIVKSGAADRILHREMVPFFKEMRLDEGLRRGLVSLMEEGRKHSFPPELRPGVCSSG